MTTPQDSLLNEEEKLHSARLSAALCGLQNRALAIFTHERERLENEVVELQKRKELALRRIKAYKKEQEQQALSNSSDKPENHAWLSLPSEIASMRANLQKSCTDESTLLTLVQEVRQKRSDLLEQAVSIYSNRDMNMDKHPE